MATSSKKAGRIAGSRKFEPLKQQRSGSLMPKIHWLHYAAISVAPYCRKFTPAKLQEHDGIAMPVSTIQRTTEQHAECIDEQEAARVIEPGTTTGGIFIGEMDGSMVPVVESPPDAEDQRKEKVFSWKAVRLNRVHPKGRVSPVFDGHFMGSVEESGWPWARCVAKAGLGPESQLHAIGDGAPWIAHQIDRQFGTQGIYFVDFFHLCEYRSSRPKTTMTRSPPVIVSSVTASINWTIKGRSPRASRLDQGKSRVRTAISSKNGSSFPALGGHPFISRRC